MVSVVIPTYNAVAYILPLIKMLKQQSILLELIFIDSQSNDGTQQILEKEKVHLVSISKNAFNHGSTRNLGVGLANYDTIVFMTQDAIPRSKETIQQLINTLNSKEDIAIAYGRQLPYPGTSLFGEFARLMNYPSQSLIKTKSLIPKMGIKTCSCSNSFAAYKKKDLLSAGGFPTDTILGEDVSVAARLILDGKAIAYCAEAEVYHSHDYTLFEEFKRYFDIGVFHREQHEVLKAFTQAESEGLKYVFEEWKFLIMNNHSNLLPKQIIRSAAKYSGYKLGQWEKLLPLIIKRAVSMHPSFWRK